jgi:hypothetical protein
VAILAPDTQEAVIQDTALEEFVELALHVVRQRAVLAGQQIEESGVVLGDELVERRPFRAAALLVPLPYIGLPGRC